MIGGSVVSGIFGIWYKNGDVVEKQHLKNMEIQLGQYGRDSQDIFSYKNIGLGGCLNQWSQHAQKDVPVYVDDSERIYLVCDAVIYNRDELIKQYSLTDCYDISTQEFLALAYKKWGMSCPEYLNGDFAFAVWEERKNQFFLFRDHMGVRPIYYYNHETVFAFSTDYRALLLLPFVEKNIDDHTMYDFLINGNAMSSDRTFFSGIKKMLPAHSLTIHDKGFTYKKYWTPGSKKKILYSTESEYAEALYGVVLDAVKKRINSTACNIGAELSGGLDSTVVDILANRELKKSGKRIHYVFSWGPSFDIFERQHRDERIFIDEVCQKEGFECVYYNIDNDIEAENPIQSTLVEDNGSVVIKQVMKSANERDVRVLLTGWGGDQGISHRTGLFELFVNGYWSYFFKEAFNLANGSPLKFLKIVTSNTVLRLFRPFNYLSRKDYDQNIANRSFNKINKKYRKKTIVYLGIDPIKHLESGNIQSRTELTAWAGAEHNVQYLFPFLDHNVVDFAMSIPRHLYYKNGINRYIYRNAFREILPKELCEYRDKDDIARITYYRNNREQTSDKEWLEEKLDKEMFSKYIEFERMKEPQGRLTEKEKWRWNQSVKKQLTSCYNLQNLLKYFRS